MGNANYKTYKNFMKILKSFIRKTKCQDARKFVDKTQYLTKTEKTEFAEYIMEYWHVYAMDIINGNYHHVNCTELVWQSYIEWKATQV